MFWNVLSKIADFGWIIFVLAFIAVVVWACVTVGKERKDVPTVEEHWHDCPSIFDGPTIELVFCADEGKRFKAYLPLVQIAQVVQDAEYSDKAYVRLTNGDYYDCWDSYEVVKEMIEQARRGTL